MSGRRAARRGLALAAAAALVGSAPTAAQEREPTGVRLTVAEAVERALARHPSVAAAEAQRRGAEAEAGEARAEWLPRFAVAGSAIRHEEPMIVAPLHGFDPARPPLFDRTLLRGDAGVSWTLFDGFGRSARVRAASAGAGAAAERARATTMELAARVVETCARILTLRDVLAAEDRRLEALRAERERAGRRVREGSAPAVERIRADAEIAAAEADRVETSSGLAAAERELARLLGGEQERIPADRLVPFEAARPDPDSSATAVRRAADGAPEVKAARRTAVAAEARLAAARSAWWPSVGLEAGLVSYGAAEEPFTNEWSAGVRVRWTVFSGGSRSARVAGAEAGARAAAAASRDAELAAAERADRATTAVRAAAARERALEAAVTHRIEVVRIEALALAEGAGLQTEYLRAEAELLAATAARAEARYAHATARAELARSLGELTPEWLRRNYREAR